MRDKGHIDDQNHRARASMKEELGQFETRQPQQIDRYDPSTGQPSVTPGKLTAITRVPLSYAARPEALFLQLPDNPIANQLAENLNSRRLKYREPPCHMMGVPDGLSWLALAVGRYRRSWWQ